MFNPTARKDEISGGGGTAVAGDEAASLLLASCRLRFLLRLPLEGVTWLKRYSPNGERRLENN